MKKQNKDLTFCCGEVPQAHHYMGQDFSYCPNCYKDHPPLRTWVNSLSKGEKWLMWIMLTVIGVPAFLVFIYQLAMWYGRI